MLVLSRKIGESIMIGDNTEVIVSDVKGNRVVFAVNAPKEIPIRRGELKPIQDKEDDQHDQTPIVD